MAPRAWSIQDAAAYYALGTSMWRHGSNVEKYRASEALLANPLHIGSFYSDSDMASD